MSVADEIAKLKELLDAGALTQEEFDRQKAQIISAPHPSAAAVQHDVSSQKAYAPPPPPVYAQPVQQQSGVVCPKCGSRNVIIQPVTKVKTKHRGCIGWAFWLLLAICTLGLILIIPLITNSKTKSKTHTEAVCQNCGFRWRT